MLPALALVLLSAPVLEAKVEQWLAQPHVRMVALVSIPEKCQSCREEAARWGSLAARHHARGLRTIAVVGRSPMFGCVDPGWRADELICDSMYDGIAKRWALPERSSTAFLWTWRGELIVSRGGLSRLESEVKRQIAATLPRIAVDVRGESRPDVLTALRASVASSNKYEPAPRTDEQARIAELGGGTYQSIYLADRKCEPGEGLNADAILGASVSGESTHLTLRSEAGCRLESVASPTTHDAVEALLAKIVQPIERPTLEQQKPEVAGSDLIEDPATPAGQLAKSRLHLSSLRDPIAKQLAQRIEKYLGRTDLTGAAFVRAVLSETFRVDVGATLPEQLECGPEVTFDLRDPERALRPGDLVFYVSYSYVPKVVVLYLGQGLIAEVADVRGVVVGKLPLELPWFFQVVARRPRLGSR